MGIEMQDAHPGILPEVGSDGSRRNRVLATERHDELLHVDQGIHLLFDDVESGPVDGLAEAQRLERGDALVEAQLTVELIVVEFHEGARIDDCLRSLRRTAPVAHGMFVRRRYDGDGG